MWRNTRSRPAPFLDKTHRRHHWHTHAQRTTHTQHSSAATGRKRPPPFSYFAHPRGEALTHTGTRHNTHACMQMVSNTHVQDEGERSTIGMHTNTTANTNTNTTANTNTKTNRNTTTKTNRNTNTTANTNTNRNTNTKELSELEKFKFSFTNVATKIGDNPLKKTHIHPKVFKNLDNSFYILVKSSLYRVLLRK